MKQLADGIWRVTFPLPWELDHVHVYLLAAPDGWVVVDTGLGSRENLERWAELVGRLEAPIVQVVVTHFHPDHVGCARHVSELTGAPVSQGEIDYAVARRVWGDVTWGDRLLRWYSRHGMSAELAERVIGEAAELRENVLWAEDPTLLRPGDRLCAAGEDWEFVLMPGHADGQLVLLGTGSGRLLAGDHLLAPITPHVGLHPESSGDPLGEYLDALDTTIALAPKIAFGGHRDPMEDPAERARELKAHHAERLEATIAAVGAGGLTAFEVSLELFGTDLSTNARRFAVAEALSHLAHLELAGRLEQSEHGEKCLWRAVE